MANKEKEKRERKSLGEIIKQANKQKILTYTAYVVIILVSTFISAYQVNFDITKITSWEFIGNLLFNYAVAIIGLFVGIQDAEQHYETTTKSEYYIAKQKYKEVIDKLYATKTNVVFPEYVVYRYKKEEQIEMENMLIEQSIAPEVAKLPNNIFEMLSYQSVAYYGNYELITGSEQARELRQKGIKTIEIQRLNEEQFEYATRLRNKGVKLPSLKYSAFLNESGSSEWRDIAYKERNKKSLKRWGFAYRAVMLLLVSSIISIAVISGNEAPAGKVATDVMNRLFNLITSIVFAYSIARTEDRMNRDICVYKTTILQDCIAETELGSWKREDLSEKVYAELDKIKQDNENVEVVEPYIPPIKEEPIAIEQQDEMEVSIDEWEKFQKWREENEKNNS